MELKDIEHAMNDYILNIGAYNNKIFANLPFYLNISLQLEKTLEKYFKDYKYEVRYEEISKISLFDKIKLIKQFYDEVGISFDIDKYINDGTIDFRYYDYFYDNEDTESYKLFRFGVGNNCYYGEKKIVNVSENGLITDIPIIIHELSHLRNQPDIKRNQVSDLLTETLAITEVFICADYLSKKGYKFEMHKLIKDQLYALYKGIVDMKSIYRMVLLFDELGSISKEDYKYYYDNDDEYEFDLEKLKNIKDKRSFITESWYILATALAPFLYCQYKKDKSFMKNIIKLHDMINNSDELECFKEMGLTYLDSAEREQLLECIDNIMNDMDNIKTL